MKYSKTKLKANWRPPCYRHVTHCWPFRIFFTLLYFLAKVINLSQKSDNHDDEIYQAHIWISKDEWFDK